MKNLKLLGFIALLAVIGFMGLGCSDSGTTTDASCTHNWDWVITKSPTTTDEGIETYKCLHCNQTGTTRPVPTVVNVISAVSISITAPVNGVVPNNTATTTDSGYTLGTVSWTPSDNPFLGGKEYIATVSLTANNGYTFTGLNSANINGQTGTVTGNTGTNATISYSFPITPTKTVSSIIIKTQPDKLTYIHNEHLDLTGLVVTLNYDDTTTEDISAVDFTGKNINANPAHGNILDRTAHNGNPVIITYGNLSQNTNNLIINNKEISSVEINITAPVKNATPTTTATGTGDYSLGNVTWSQTHGKFLGGEIYTASVTLTANSGFVFTGLTSVTINGHNNEILNNTGSTITLSHTFSRTDERAVYDLDIKTQPTRLIYTHGNHLDLTGLVVTLTHDDSTIEDVVAVDFDIKNINAIPADGNTLTRVNHHGQPIVITYGELTALTNNLVINPKVITFSIEPISTVLYTGNTHTPVVVVRDGDLLLSLGIDYTVGYANNINKGTATVTVTGVNNYLNSTGNATFTINPIVTELIIDSIPSETYTGNAIAPNMIVRNGVTLLVLNTDFIVGYTNNVNVGTATVTVTGIGNYEGSTCNSTFVINKASGAIVDSPTVALKTTNSITINTVTAPNNGQTVEYSINTNSLTSGLTWQSGLTFNGLNVNTNYYIFARSASNNNYNSGITSVSSVITTTAQGYFTITFNQIVDEVPFIAGPTIYRLSANGSTTATINIDNAYEYQNITWYITGTDIVTTGASIILSSTNQKYNIIGEHFLTVEVVKDGKKYNKTITFMVER